MMAEYLTVQDVQKKLGLTYDTARRMVLAAAAEGATVIQRGKRCKILVEREGFERAMAAWQQGRAAWQLN
jgi:hypothetical protein